MKKALIPVLFVISGGLASGLWSTVEFPCRATQVEIASVVASSLVRCAGEELLRSELAHLALSSAAEFTEKPERWREPLASVFFQVLLGQAFEGFPLTAHETEWPYMTISRQLRERCVKR